MMIIGITLVLGIIVGLLVLSFLVALHEFGHAWVGTKNGVVIEEFSIGFGPKIFQKQLKNKDKTLFTLRLLPLGGFVKPRGEQHMSTEKGGYGAASFWVKTKILLAGVLINFLFAAVLFAVISINGLPKFFEGQFAPQRLTTITSASNASETTVVTVAENSPAAKAGLQENDAIIRINEQRTLTAQELVSATRAHQNQTVEVVYLRDGMQKTAKATLNDSSNSNGVLGVGMAGQARQIIKAKWWAAPVVGVVTTVQLTGQSFVVLGQTLANFGSGVAGQFGNQEQKEQANKDLAAASENTAGPLAIFGIFAPNATQNGFWSVLLLAASISLALAVTNLLPIPGLDGARFYTMAIFRILKKPLTEKAETIIQTIGFFLIMTLLVLVTWGDIFKFKG